MLADLDSERGLEVVGYGIDDMTLGFNLEGSSSIPLLQDAPGLESRRGKMLGQRASWGAWGHLLGRSASFWKADTKRLYVQARLGDEGELCPPEDARTRVRALVERMAAVGIFSYEEPWATRIDVAVDARCRPEDGKLLLDALEAVRLPNGWRTRSVGVPRSTVYFSARANDSVYARAYCRNLKLRKGEPFGLIRLEAERRFAPLECAAEKATDPEFIASLWLQRFGGLSATVTRVERELQTVEIAARVAAGELKPQQGERLAMFLDLERLGLGKVYYPTPLHAARRREAVELGYGANDTGSKALEVNLSELLEPYCGAVRYAA